MKYEFINQRHGMRVVFMANGKAARANSGVTLNRTQHRQLLGALCPAMGRECDCGGIDSGGNAWEVCRIDENTWKIREKRESESAPAQRDLFA